MASLILIILFSIFAFVESTTYGLYEIKVNKNKVRWDCSYSTFPCHTYISYCNLYK